MSLLAETVSPYRTKSIYLRSAVGHMIRKPYLCRSCDYLIIWSIRAFLKIESMVSLKTNIVIFNYIKTQRYVSTHIYSRLSLFSIDQVRATTYLYQSHSGAPRGEYIQSGSRSAQLRAAPLAEILIDHTWTFTKVKVLSHAATWSENIL